MEISDRIAQSNVNNKLWADIRKRLKTFNIGEFVMDQIHPKRFSLGTIRSAGPFHILKKLNNNTML